MEMVKESIVMQPVEVELPMTEMVEPVMVESMAEAKIMSYHAMMAKAVTEAEVATTPMVAMVSVMPNRLGRQHLCSYHETPDKKGECNSSHSS